MRKILTRTAILSLALAGASPALAAEDVVIVYDASGSMWGQIDGTSKIEIARNVLGDLVKGWDQDTNLGLVAYGHRQQGDCSDIETLITPAPLDRDAFIKTVNDIRPNGMTPLTAAVQQAAELLSYRDNAATVVLISDGLENCNADPCAISAELAEQGVNFTAHVVGFDIEDAAHESLACIADNTGGIFVPASDADELHAALAEVKTAVEQTTTEPAPDPEPEPEPEPEPAATLPEVSLYGPEQVTTGASFDFRWSESIHDRDYITIVPAGADEGDYTSFVRAGNNTEDSLRAPGTPGLYELRYVLDEGRHVLASVPFEVVEARVTLHGPEQVTTGASFDFRWSESIHDRDYITIVPAGADEGDYTSFVRAGNNTEGSLRAPGTPGLYELRYVLDEGRHVLASVPFEVVEARVTLHGPEQVTTGASFDFRWSESIHDRDYITIVPAGADEGDYTSFVRAGNNTEDSLRAPGTPGLYELRYVLDEGRHVLASVPFEVVEVEMGIHAPATIRAGEEIDINWSESIHPRDYITIVPAGADDSEYDQFQRAGNADQMRMTAPAEVGLYEIRYVLDEGRRVLARTMIEVVDANAPMDEGAGLSVPETADPGEVITVSWTGGGGDGDERIALARKNQPDFSWIAAFPAGDSQSQDITMPDDPGLYEIRFLDIAGPKLLGRAVIEVK